MDLLAKTTVMRPNSAFAVKKVLQTLADPLSAALKTPVPSRFPYDAHDQLSDSLRNVSGQQNRSARHQTAQDPEWDQIENTPIVEASPPSISIMWYLLPLSLFALLIYLIMTTFK